MLPSLSLPVIFLLFKPLDLLVLQPHISDLDMPARIHCGCDLCQRTGKQTVSRSTYQRHKKHRNNGLSSQFNQFINAQTRRISESETPSSHSNDDVPMPFNSGDGVDGQFGAEDFSSCIFIFASGSGYPRRVTQHPLDMQVLGRSSSQNC